MLLKNKVCMWHFLLNWSGIQWDVSKCKEIVLRASEESCRYRTMYGAVREHQSLVKSVHSNLRISRARSKVEYLYAFF